MRHQEHELLLEKLHLALRRCRFTYAVLTRTFGLEPWDELTDAQLRRALTYFTFKGALFGAARGQTSRNGPTPWQRERFAALAQAVGCEAANDPRLVRFLRREIGVDHPRFLDRRTMGQALAALRRLRDSGYRFHQDSGPESPAPLLHNAK